MSVTRGSVGRVARRKLLRVRKVRIERFGEQLNIRALTAHQLLRRCDISPAWHIERPLHEIIERRPGSLTHVVLQVKPAAGAGDLVVGNRNHVAQRRADREVHVRPGIDPRRAKSDDALIWQRPDHARERLADLREEREVAILRPGEAPQRRDRS